MSEASEYNIPVLVKADVNAAFWNRKYQEMVGTVIMMKCMGQGFWGPEGNLSVLWDKDDVIPHPTAAQVREEATKAGKPVPPEYQEKAAMKPSQDDCITQAAKAFGITPESARAALEKAREEESRIKVGDVVTWRSVMTFEVKFITPKFVTDYQDNDWTVSDSTKVTHPEVIAYVKGLRK